MSNPQTAAATSQPSDRSGSTAFKRWLRPALVGALTVSLVFHVAMMIVAMLIIFSRGGSDEGGTSPVEFAVISEADLQALQEANLQTDLPPIPEARVEVVTPSIDLSTEELSLDPDGALTDTSDLVSDLGGSDVTGGDVSASGGGGGAASFFGVEARGTRFAFIVDVSGSMSVGGKIEALKRELLKSVTNLGGNGSFSIILFSDGAYPLGNDVKWTDANDTGKRRARDWIERIVAQGATVPGPAFDLIFKLRPRPDAIYFMTDGEFDPGVPVEVWRQNRTAKVPVHCICFESRGSEEMMKKIARESDGTYTFVPGETP